jgi:hypothetical protein
MAPKPVNKLSNLIQRSQEWVPKSHLSSKALIPTRELQARKPPHRICTSMTHSFWEWGLEQNIPLKVKQPPEQASYYETAPQRCEQFRARRSSRLLFENLSEEEGLQRPSRQEKIKQEITPCIVHTPAPPLPPFETTKAIEVPALKFLTDENDRFPTQSYSLSSDTQPLMEAHSDPRLTPKRESNPKIAPFLRSPEDTVSFFCEKAWRDLSW